MVHASAVPYASIQKGNLQSRSLPAFCDNDAPQELWFGGQMLIKACAHTLDKHWAAVVRNGITLYIVGPGAPADYYVSLAATQVAGAFKNFHELRYRSAAHGFGSDTMVIAINGPRSPQPWRARILSDKLLAPEHTVAAAHRAQDMWETTNGSCGAHATGGGVCGFACTGGAI
jgi:hypothetical protein